MHKGSMRCALVLSFSCISPLLKTLKQNYMCIFRVCIIQKQTEANYIQKRKEKLQIVHLDVRGEMFLYYYFVFFFHFQN